MRGRIVLFVVLAVVAALVGVYLGRSTTTPMAVGEPATATPADSSVGSTLGRAPRSGPSHSPAPSSPKAPPPKAPPPKAPPPKACSSTPAAQPPASTTVSDPPPPAADQVYFGQVSIRSFDDSAQIFVSEDYQALTTTFDKFVIEVQKGAGECDVTRSLSMTLPVTGPAQAARVRFFVQGYAFTDQGASARLAVRGNGQVKVKSFPAGFDDSYIQTLEFPATPGATYMVSVQLEVHQNPDTGGFAHLNMLSIDIGVT